ncbi:MAG: HipA N-terminal domain-containing protein [Bacteroidales bacterium]|nr:HipA N-terminal domain-containing protein [Bacteroidales bacterium]
MRAVNVYYNKIHAGVLIENDSKNYIFAYNDDYFADSQKPAISLTLPKTRQMYIGSFLFPFFFNMLSEGVNKKLQSRQLKIDENDSFGLLMHTAENDTIGAVTVKKLNEDELQRIEILSRNSEGRILDI